MTYNIHYNALFLYSILAMLYYNLFITLATDTA